MSDYLKPTLYTGRALENQLKNSIFNLHDLICGCNETSQHILHLFSEEKCLHFKEGGTLITKEDNHGDANLDEGDLDALFADTDEDLG